ncbi:hypothetical protein ACFE04_008353 [Oxalis oulophora]
MAGQFVKCLGPILSILIRQHVLWGGEEKVRQEEVKSTAFPLKEVQTETNEESYEKSFLVRFTDKNSRGQGGLRAHLRLNNLSSSSSRWTLQEHTFAVLRHDLPGYSTLPHLLNTASSLRLYRVLEADFKVIKASEIHKGIVPRHEKPPE